MTSLSGGAAAPLEPPSHYGEQQREWYADVARELQAAPPADIQLEIRRQHARTADADMAYRRCRSATDDKVLLRALRYEYVRLRVLFDLSFVPAAVTAATVVPVPAAADPTTPAVTDPATPAAEPAVTAPHPN